ncbi:uncharacterized protein LOC114169400 [Vigna unguiculata]|uniref:uncharacterized protein LOC114169400 n=1 Tax=Vigna unguiculata TaxID=3917 RepID=UPI00101602B4|nr:uncharacterized protein LOC114169400 [Vigna unguiculata]
MGGMIQGGLPIFDGSMFNDWKIKMNAIFIFQDVAKVVEHGVSPPGAKATDDDKKAYKIQHKLDGKARYLIDQCVSSPIFNRISMAGTTKEAWDILVATYGAGDKHKKVKLQALQRQFEFLIMEESDSVVGFLNKIQELVNDMRSCGDKVSEQHIVNQVLRSLPPRFDHLVITIEETKDLDALTFQELQHSLKAHELRMYEQRSYQEQVLHARTNGKQKKDSKKGSKTKKKGESDEQKNKDHKQNSGEDKEKKYDKKKVKYYNCLKFGHYARDSWDGDGAKNRPKKNVRVHLVEEENSDEEVVMLMAETDAKLDGENLWYLDSGCSTHMTGKKDWFVQIRDVSQEKIRFADNSSLTTKGTGRVVLRNSDGKDVIIENVLHVPGLKSNLLSLGQLMQRGFKMTLKDKSLRVFDQTQKLVILVGLSSNQTFQVKMNALKHQCFAAVSDKCE